MSDHTHDLDRRLAALESRLGRLESLLDTLDTKLDGAAERLGDAKSSIQAWVTDYVSMRLQQRVLHRLGRIPIPFVRQMVTQKVAETARAEQVGLVDVTFFERAATF